MPVAYPFSLNRMALMRANTLSVKETKHATKYRLISTFNKLKFILTAIYQMFDPSSISSNPISIIDHCLFD